MSDNLSRLLDLADTLQAEAPHGMNSSRASTCRYAAEELLDKRARLAEAERLLRNSVNPLVNWDDLADEIDVFLGPADSAEDAPVPAPEKCDCAEPVFRHRGYAVYCGYCDRDIPTPTVAVKHE